MTALELIAVFPKYPNNPHIIPMIIHR